MGAVLYTIHIIIAVFLILVILLQQGKGTELGAAFGGASQTVFGGASGRESFLVRVTVVLGVIFLLMSLGLSLRASHIQKTKIKVPKAKTAPASVPVLPGAPSPTAPGSEKAGEKTQ